MGEAKSPRITKSDVKAHFRYVWDRRKQKVKRKLKAVPSRARTKLTEKAVRLYDRLPIRVVFKKDMVEKVVDPMAFLSAQDLYLPEVIGRPGYLPLVRREPIHPHERGDVATSIPVVVPTTYTGPFPPKR